MASEELKKLEEGFLEKQFVYQKKFIEYEVKRRELLSKLTEDELKKDFENNFSVNHPYFPIHLKNRERSREIKRNEERKKNKKYWIISFFICLAIALAGIPLTVLGYKDHETTMKVLGLCMNVVPLGMWFWLKQSTSK